MTKTRGKLKLRELPPFTAVAILWILLFAWGSFQYAGFATITNLQNIAQAGAVPGILAVGLTLTMLLRGIDLSVGSLLALTGVVMALQIPSVPDWFAIFTAVVFAVIVSASTTALLIGPFRLNPFIVTLGGLSLFRGLSFIVSDGQTKSVESHLLNEIGFGNVLGVPIPLIVLLAVTFSVWFILRYTFYGRDIYSIGGNPEAATIAGIRVSRVTFSVYVICGLCVGIAAVLQTGRNGSSAPTAVTGIELQVIAAVLLGGTRLSGGVGSVVGSVIAVLFLSTVNNALTLAGVQSFWQQVISGILLLAAVVLDRVRTVGLRDTFAVFKSQLVN